jgi:multidrug resistance efflux pump
VPLGEDSILKRDSLLRLDSARARARVDTIKAQLASAILDASAFFSMG